MNNERDTVWQRPFAVAAIVSAFILLASLCAGSVRFYVNDDFGIQAILSGATSGTPTGYTVFSSVLICEPLSWLYKLFPPVPWWYITLLLAQYCSTIAWCYITIKITSRHLRTMFSHRVAVWLSLSLAAFSGYSISFLEIAHPTFTFAAASLAASGGSLFLIGLICPWIPKRDKTRISIAAVLFIFFSSLIRFNCGIVGVCFLLAICAVTLMRNIRQQGNDGRYIASVSSIAIALVMFVWVANSFFYSAPEWKQFKEINSARSSYMDYPHDLYEENPGLYNEVGWDEPLAMMVSRWFFMDDRVDANAFRSLSSHSNPPNPIESTRDNILEHSGVFNSIQFSTLFSLALALFVAILLFSKREQLNLSIPIAVIITAFLFLAYLLIAGRFIFRATLCALLPAVFILWAFFLENMTFKSSKKRPINRAVLLAAISVSVATTTLAIYLFLKTGFADYAIGILPIIPLIAFLFTYLNPIGEQTRFSCAVIALCLLAIWLPNILAAKHDMDFSDAVMLVQNEQMNELFNYANAHSECLFIYPAALSSTDPFAIRPKNAFSWGGWSYYAPWAKDRYASWGYPSGIHGFNFLDEGVLLVFPADNDSYADNTLTYLESISSEPVRLTTYYLGHNLCVCDYKAH